MAISPTEPDSRRERLWLIIILSDTKAGHVFDVVLLWVMVLSTLTVLLDSVDELREPHGTLFLTLEWVFTGLFTLEYLMPLWACAGAGAGQARVEAQIHFSASGSCAKDQFRIIQLIPTYKRSQS